MGEVDDLRDELADAEVRLAQLPQVDEVEPAGSHEALALVEERNELAQRIEALRESLAALGC